MARERKVRSDTMDGSTFSETLLDLVKVLDGKVSDEAMIAIVKIIMDDVTEPATAYLYNNRAAKKEQKKARKTAYNSVAKAKEKEQKKSPYNNREYMSWTTEEDLEVKAFWSDKKNWLNDREISVAALVKFSKRFGRNANAIRQRAKKLGLK